MILKNHLQEGCQEVKLNINANYPLYIFKYNEVGHFGAKYPNQGKSNRNDRNEKKIKNRGRTKIIKTKDRSHAIFIRKNILSQVMMRKRK